MRLLCTQFAGGSTDAAVHDFVQFITKFKSVTSFFPRTILERIEKPQTQYVCGQIKKHCFTIYEVGEY